MRPLRKRQPPRELPTFYPRHADAVLALHRWNWTSLAEQVAEYQRKHGKRPRGHLRRWSSVHLRAVFGNINVPSEVLLTALRAQFTEAEWSFITGQTFTLAVESPPAPAQVAA